MALKGDITHTVLPNYLALYLSHLQRVCLIRFLKERYSFTASWQGSFIAGTAPSFSINRCANPPSNWASIRPFPRARIRASGCRWLSETDMSTMNGMSFFEGGGFFFALALVDLRRRRFRPFITSWRAMIEKKLFQKLKVHSTRNAKLRRIPNCK